MYLLPLSYVLYVFANELQLFEILLHITMALPRPLVAPLAQVAQTTTAVLLIVDFSICRHVRDERKPRVGVAYPPRSQRTPQSTQHQGVREVFELVHALGIGVGRT